MASDKIKVGALAKALKIEAKELLKTLHDLGVEAKTSASSIDAEAAKLIKDLFKEKSAPPTAKPQPESKPAKTAPTSAAAEKTTKAAAESTAEAGKIGRAHV